MDYTLPGSSVHGIYRQEYWSGLSFPSPGGLPNSGIEPRSPILQVEFLAAEPQGKPKLKSKYVYIQLKNAFGTS